MLSRRREQIVLLLGLIVLNALLAWDVRRLWQDYQQRTRWIHAATPPKSTPPATAPSQGALPTQSFAEIVDRNMFTPERTSQSPKDEVKAPELPVLYGTMSLGEGWFALMAPGDQGASGFSKRVGVGEEIGGYKLISISGSRVEVEWNGKTFHIDAADSVRRARSVASAVRAEPVPTPARDSASASGGPRVTMVGTPSSASGPVSSGTSRQRSNVASNGPPPGAPPDAPAGTVIGGKRKVVNPTPFGDQVFWVDADKPAQGEKKDQ
ncbi:MAG TPA: hypothetical protein VG204_18965 [Terriglobia bacterium]|nr:hypothetical protein [Terriglobia bacterium]